MSYDFIPLDFRRLESEEQRRRAAEFYELMRRRRTVREFSPGPAPFELIERLPDGSERKIKHYYVNESVGIACGMLLAALHNVGLATLTHTPNPMGFLNEILKRPKNEKPYLLVPVGYPADGVKVPTIELQTLYCEY
jgi:nitroreductase